MEHPLLSVICVKVFFIHGIFHCVQFSILEIRKLTCFTSCHVYTRYILKAFYIQAFGNKQMHLNIELPITTNIEVFDYQLSMELLYKQYALFCSAFVQ